MTSPGDISDFGDMIVDTYFSTPAATRWTKLLNFLDRCRGSMTRSTEGQRAAVMHDIAWAISAALLKRDPSLQPAADALLARCPPPDDEMICRELGVGSVLQ